MSETTGKRTIAIASTNFTQSFPLRAFKFLEKNIGTEYELKEVNTFVNLNSLATETDHLEILLENDRPYALIGLCVNLDVNLLKAYRAAGVPVALIDGKAEGFTSITTDNVTGGHIAGEYLAKIGRKKIALMSGRVNIPGSFVADQRLEGLLKALKEQGIEFSRENFISLSSYGYTEGVFAYKKFMEKPRDIDAIFCAAGDVPASGVLKTAFEMGIKIPEQIAVVGYDDLEIAQITKPPLTTIKQPIELMAKKAFEAVTENRDKTLKSDESIVFSPELVIRESA
jgi:LacI family transcriptional regulator